MPGVAWAHGEGRKDTPRKISTEEKTFGREGDPKRITRTIHVDMADTMRYSPMQITVKRGETVRFVAKNTGKVMHEMVLGTMQELKEHFELMKKFPGMEHDEPHMAHVKPGKSAQMVWQFTKAGEFYYGCLMPGHFEAGMIGKVIVK
jgi:uncharacterized cupredoxin-like copper-binding protein